MDSLGIIFPGVPKMNGNFTEDTIRNTWVLIAIVLRVESFWKIVEKNPLRTSDWHGWMLVYLYKTYFYSKKRQAKNDPFKFRFISSVVKFFEKVKCSNLRTTVTELNGVYYFHGNDDLRIDLNTDTDHDIGLSIMDNICSNIEFPESIKVIIVDDIKSSMDISSDTLLKIGNYT